MTLLKHDEVTSRDSDETRWQPREHVVENRDERRNQAKLNDDGHRDYSSIINGMQHRVDQAMENFDRSINTQVGRLEAAIKVARFLPFFIRIPEHQRCSTERLLFLRSCHLLPTEVHPSNPIHPHH